MKQSRNAIFCFLAIAALAAFATITPAAAHETDGEIHDSGPAAQTPIAVPFIGSYDVWCTSGNPAPGNLCATHHTGPAIDFGMDPGTPINATGDGEVVDIETTCVGFGFCRNGAGNFIVIEHADDRFSRYLHLQDVFVEVGDLITVGDEIGTTGVTGQTSSPHLHYDEQWPRGTRIDMGTWIGCVEGQQVVYPDSFGFTDWYDVPFGTVMRNDGYDCLAGAALQAAPTSPLPIIASGEGIFGLAAPLDFGPLNFEARITDASGDQQVTLINTGEFSLFDDTDGPYEILIRPVDGSTTYSDVVVYDGSAVTSAPVCEGLHATGELTGTPGPDVIIGTAGDDVIDGRGGNDFICAGDGDDQILGGRGADRIFGQSGDDTIGAGYGADYVLGGYGADNIRGGNGPDFVNGGPGDDIVHGTAGNDTVEGGNGNDFVLGGIGHDLVKGGADNDRLEGRNGRDVLQGGNGDDEVFGNNGLDRLIGGAGNDFLDGGEKDDRCVPDPSDGTPAINCER